MSRLSWGLTAKNFTSDHRDLVQVGRMWGQTYNADAANYSESAIMGLLKVAAVLLSIVVYSRHYDFL